MAISPPSIVGVLSPISDSIRLQGQMTGSTIEVFRNGSERIAHHPATASDQNYQFDAGVNLQPGDAITAIQEYGGETSAQTPMPTLVQNLVPPFGGQRFVSHVFRCGTSLFLTGIVPGAEVHLNAGSAFRGKAKSVDGGAIVELTAATGNNEQIEARQFIMGAFGPAVQSPSADPPPPLNNFSVDTPRACMPGIRVRNVIDGAEVKILEDRGDPQSEKRFRVPMPSQFLLLKPLAAGQKLSVQERMERCELQSPELKPDVLPMAFYTRPLIKGPLCAGTKRIELQNLTPGVIVTARQGSTVVGTAQATEDRLEMWVNPLAGNTNLIVTETLCGVSADSFPEPVTGVPLSVPAAKLIEPLFDCVMQLSLENVYPGSYVCAMSREKGPISQWRRMVGPEGILQLDTPLQNGHHVRVLQSACGGDPSESNEARVQPVPNLELPILEGKVFYDQPVVHARNVVPGAVVQLYSRERGFISSATADKDGRAMLPKSTLYGWTLPGDHLHARQMLCAQRTEFGPFEEVIDRTPRAPIIIEPVVGQTGVGQRPILRWSDPGAGTIRQAAGFLLEMTHASNPQFNAPLILNEVVNGTSKSMNQDLAFSDQLLWRVTAYVGDPGFEVRSPSSTATFTVMAQPAPPAQLAFSKVAIFNCHTGHRAVTIYSRDVTAGEDWDEVEQLGAQYDGGTCPTGAATPVEVSLTDGHYHTILAIDPDMPACPGDDPSQLACRRDEFTVLGSDDGPVLYYAIDIGILA